MADKYSEAALATEYANTAKHKVHTERNTKVVINLTFKKNYDPNALFTALAGLGVVTSNKRPAPHKPVMHLNVS